MPRKSAQSQGFNQILAIVFSLLALTATDAQARNPLGFELRAAPSGEKYAFVYINNAPVKLMLTLPDKNDSKLLMSIPAAFTSAEGKIVGVYVHGGSVNNKVDPKLGGALKIMNGTYEVLDTKSGALLTQEYLNDVASRKGSLIQQFGVVKNRVASTFKDKTKFQRRGIGILKDGKEVIVESKGVITLGQFASDLAVMGMKDFLYTDMGAWGGGWVRDPKDGKLITIGNERHFTASQTSWIVVSEPVEKKQKLETNQLNDAF